MVGWDCPQWVTCVKATFAFHRRQSELASRSRNSDDGVPDGGGAGDDDGVVDRTLDWEPNKLVWCLDGVPRFAQTGSDVDSHAHYVMFNLSIGGSRSWGGASDSSTQLPSMRVDWVRVWQRS